MIKKSRRSGRTFILTAAVSRYLLIGLFQKKIVTPLLRISMEYSRGGDRIKSLEFQGGTHKLRRKWISRGSKQKDGKFQGGHGKFDWKSREVNFKKIDILDRGGGGTIFFLEKPIFTTLKGKEKKSCY